MLPTFCLEGEGCYHDDEVDGHLLIKFFRLETGADRVSECRKAGGVVCQLWLGGVRGRHQALPTPPLLHWSTTTWRSNVQQGGKQGERMVQQASRQPAGEDWFCGLPCCPGPARCIVLCGALTLPVRRLCTSLYTTWCCGGGGAIVAWCILTAGMCAIASLSYTFCHPPQRLPKYLWQ